MIRSPVRGAQDLPVSKAADVVSCSREHQNLIALGNSHVPHWQDRPQPSWQKISMNKNASNGRSVEPQVNLAAVARAVSIPFGPPGTPVNARSPAHNWSEVHAQSTLEDLGV